MSIERVRMSREQFIVYGTALGGDCGGIEVALDLRGASGQSLWASRQSVEWISTERWRATFALTPERREIVCSARQSTDSPLPPWSVSATCPDCENTAYYSGPIACCPSLAIIAADPAVACEDPDFTGLLSRRVTVRWRVDRRDAAGAISTRASIETPDRILHGEDRVLAEDLATGVFEDDAFLMPSGVASKVRVALVGDDGGCSESVQTLDIAPLPPCSCDTQPHSVEPFAVVDADGRDVTEAVLAGRCIGSARATVRAPSDAASARFEWVAPAKAEPSDPFATAVAIPDTDEGITVVARFGSAPCVRERSIVLKRCQTRPDFCARLPFTCIQIAVMWAVVFYLASFVCYIGLGLMSAGSSSVESDLTTAAISSTNSSTAAFAALAAYSAATASIAVAIGLGMVTAGVCGYLAWCALTLLWFACCAPRNQCRYIRSMLWILKLIAYTIPLWALVMLVVGLLLQLKIYTLAGIGVATLFGYMLTVPLAMLFELSAKLARCQIPNAFDIPPFFEDSP